jgi:hypothetical protein
MRPRDVTGKYAVTNVFVCHFNYYAAAVRVHYSVATATCEDLEPYQ